MKEKIIALSASCLTFAAIYYWHYVSLFWFKLFNFLVDNRDLSVPIFIALIVGFIVYFRRRLVDYLNSPGSSDYPY